MTTSGQTTESCLSLEVQAEDSSGRYEDLATVQECIQNLFEVWEPMLEEEAP